VDLVEGLADLKRTPGFDPLVDSQRSKQNNLNIELAEHFALSILYTRFLIFDCFLAQAKESGQLESATNDFRRRWTYLQLQPAGF
jgi:hypothetical protein